jgi:HEAT repeat protein
VLRVAAFVILLACGVGAAVWYYSPGRMTSVKVETAVDDDAWLDQLYSSNPAEAEGAAHHVQELGADALPVIHKIFQDPSASPERVKAALKACGILGPIAAPAVGEVAEQLPDPTVTAEAAVALSFMGRSAFGPLREALRSEDPVVRREALRSIGKLKERAPLDARAVLPLLIDSLEDADPGVRTVAATYLGIIHEGSAAVPPLVEALMDPEPTVRRAAAAALGSFGAEADAAIPALKKAAGDADPDVAREAGLALVKLQPQK